MPITKPVRASSVVRRRARTLWTVSLAPHPRRCAPGRGKPTTLMLQRIVAVAQPKGAIEEFLTRDVVDLTWEISRVRRLKAALLRDATSKGIQRILSTIGYGLGLDMRSSEEFAAGWASGDADTRREFAEKDRHYDG